MKTVTPRQMEVLKFIRDFRIKNAYSPGGGAPVANQLGEILRSSEKFKVLHQLQEVIEDIEGRSFPLLIPEVGTNIAYALPGAKDPVDVAGISGRIVKIGGSAKAVGRIEFGASKHVASIVLAAMAHDPAMRCSMNIRFSERILNIIKDLDLSVSSFKREEEPQQVSTMEWGTDHAIQDLGRVPDVIFDQGGIGKEAMIRVLGRDPISVWEKVKRVMSSL